MKSLECCGNCTFFVNARFGLVNCSIKTNYGPHYICKVWEFDGIIDRVRRDHDPYKSDSVLHYGVKYEDGKVYE